MPPRDAFPDVVLDEALFAAYVETRAPNDGSALSLDDLYLACAASHGDARALAHIEARCFTGLEKSLAKMNLSSTMIDEVLQGLRHQIFVADDGKPPGITGYAGRGPLGAWLRVTATRAALRALKKGKKEVALDEDERFADEAARTTAPEVLHLKSQYGEAFKECFVESLRGLAPKDRALLKQHFIDGLTVDQIGPLHQVHRATAARWIQSAREELMKATRKSLMKRAGVSKTECDSILRAVHSQFDVTLRSLLGVKREP